MWTVPGIRLIKQRRARLSCSVYLSKDIGYIAHTFQARRQKFDSGLGTYKIIKEPLTNGAQRRFDGWMDDLRFYVLFNSISVISGRLTKDDERLCAKEPRLRLRRVRLQRGSNSGAVDKKASGLSTKTGLLALNVNNQHLQWMEG